MEYIYSSNDKTNVNNNQQEELGIIDLKLFNQLTITNAITQMAPSPRPSTNHWGWGICMSDFDMARRKFANTPKDKFQDQ